MVLGFRKATVQSEVARQTVASKALSLAQMDYLVDRHQKSCAALRPLHTADTPSMPVMTDDRSRSRLVRIGAYLDDRLPDAHNPFLRNVRQSSEEKGGQASAALGAYYQGRHSRT